MLENIKPLSTTMTSNIYAKYINESDMQNERIKIHDFRHSHILFLIDLGVDVFHIAKRVGDSNPEMIFKVYGHLYPDKEQKIIDKIEVCCHIVATENKIS